MKKITTKELSRENPELFKKILTAYDLVLPEIAEHVERTLEKMEIGSIAIHGSFLKIINEDTKQIYFIELDMVFQKMPIHKLKAGLAYIIFYDTFHEYETARQKLAKESVLKHGNETFPTFQHFNGKNIGNIPDDEIN